MQFTEGGTAQNSDSDTLRYMDFVSCDVNVHIDIYCTYYAPIMLFNSNSQVRSTAHCFERGQTPPKNLTYEFSLIFLKLNFRQNSFEKFYT